MQQMWKRHPVLVRVVVAALFVATFAAALVVVMHALHVDAVHVFDQWQEWWQEWWRDDSRSVMADTLSAMSRLTLFGLARVGGDGF
jgi:hypothetical protein